MTGIIKTTEFFRYILNGLAATLIHFLALYLFVSWNVFQLYGLSNITASIFGISFSFLGNRYYVFQTTKDDSSNLQLVKFGGLYALLALTHGITMFVLSDIGKMPYQFAFLIAMAIQITLGYLGNKHVIFVKKSNGL